MLNYAKNGEPVFIEWNGIILKLVKEVDKSKTDNREFDYRTIIHSNVDEADIWSWDWKANKEIKLKNKKQDGL